jgi:phosphatidylglycerophosphatase A
MNNSGRRVVLFLATGAFSGYTPIMPGTAGSVIGIGLFLVLSQLNYLAFLCITLSFIFLSILIAEKAATIINKPDPSIIVIDEIAGYLVTMITFPSHWLYIAAGFVLFRLLDIAKPYPINWIDTNVSGGLGIVLDDVAAGIYANLILQLLRLLFEG